MVTDRQTDKTTTVTLRRMHRGLTRAACEKLHYINDQPQLTVFCPFCDTIVETPPTSDGDHRHAAVLEKTGCECVQTSRYAPLTDRHTIWLAEESQSKM